MPETPQPLPRKVLQGLRVRLGAWLSLRTVLTLPGVGSLFALAFWYRLKGRALVPVGDPRLEQSLEFENV